MRTDIPMRRATIDSIHGQSNFAIVIYWFYITTLESHGVHLISFVVVSPCKKRTTMGEEHINEENYTSEYEEENTSKENQVSNENEEKSDQKMDKKARKMKKKIMKRLIKESSELEKRGVCYISRIPPRMTPLKLRQILQQFGEVLRIYLVPEDAAKKLRRTQAGGNRKKDEFTEGWVEFARKSVAKRVAEMLNGEQIGGKRRSCHYYDLWNIKYLTKFKWDDLTGETALKHAVREQKLAMEISTAKRQRDFYLSKVDQSRSIKKYEERIIKKQKLENRDTGDSHKATSDAEKKPLRYFPQKQSVTDKVSENLPRLSKDVLKGVFGH